MSASTSDLAPAPDASPEFTDVDFDHIATLLTQRSGASLGGGCSALLRERAAAYVQQHGPAGLDALLRNLKSADESSAEQLTRLLGFGCNGFFRDEAHFKILAQHLRSRPAYRPIEIWCAGCSGGQELYSIIIAACEVFGTLTPPIHIVASDYDAHMLALAKDGSYSRAQIERLPTPYRRRFFRATERHGEIVQVRQELRELVTFRQIDLRAATWGARPHFDAIFCRSTLNTLDWQTQANALAKFDELLDEEGLLFVGRDDNVEQANATLSMFAHAVYRKKP